MSTVCEALLYVLAFAAFVLIGSAAVKNYYRGKKRKTGGD